MAKYEPSALRNIAIAGHGGTGKTSLCEAFLFCSGKTDRLGKVNDGSSSMDFEPEEQKRRISISAAANFFDWEKHRVNILDTPGDSSFATDIIGVMHVVDCSLIVVDAVGGVDSTEKVWEYADRLSLPRIIYVNKMDRERADFFSTMDSVKKKLGKKPTPIFLPVGAEESFKGVIDLLNMKAMIFEGAKGAYKIVDVPEDMAAEAKSFRDSMVEDIAEGDESLMDKYLETGELSIDELKAGLRRGIISRDLLPIFCGSALKMIGIRPLMDAIGSYLPSRSIADQ